MKLKHLLLAALAVGAFASCSKDDDGPNEPAYQQIETGLSFSTTSNGGARLKSSVEEGNAEAGEKNERKIKTLTAVVFYDDGTFATSKTVENPEQDENFNTSIDGIVVKVAATEAGQVSDTKLKVFLLANVTVPQSALTSYDTFISSSFSGISEYSFDQVMKESSYLPMSSQELTVTKLLAGTAYNNWVESSGDVSKYTSNETEKENLVLVKEGDKYVPGTNTYEPTNRISLTRYVARVQLESLTVDFGENYKEAAFTLTSVSVANASNASRYVENENGRLQPEGLYNNNNDFYRGYPENIDRADYYLARSQYEPTVFSKSYGTIGNGSVSGGIRMGKDGETSVQFSDQTTSKEEGKYEMAQFYVFEFQSVAVTSDPQKELPSTASKSINTMLIITGFWDNGPIKEERSFRIPIRHTNNEGDYQVKRNYIYKVHATLTGEGTNNPDKSMLNAFVSFSINVEPWKVIIQNETDLN